MQNYQFVLCIEHLNWISREVFLEKEDFFSWTIKTIRHDISKPVWLEDRKTEWVPLVQNTIASILEGYTIIIMSDNERLWFVDYAIGFINRSCIRPFIPLYALSSLYTQLTYPSERIELIQDMLSTSFDEKYLFWYVGKADSVCAKLAFGHDYSFNWLLDENRENSFSLVAHDELLDIKLLQLLRIFDKSITAALHGEISIGV